MSDPVWEAARRIAQEAAQEIGEALGSGGGPGSSESETSEPIARFRAAVLAAEGELSAAAIAPLSTPELGSIIRLVAQLALEVPRVGTEGDRWNALSSSLGRRARRRVRKALGEIDDAAIASIDFEAWRAELRGMASARVLESTDFEFRLALTAWLQTGDSGDGDTAEAIPPEADVSQLVADRPEALALLRSVVNAWVEAL